jgi:hypothetical protein
MFPKPRTATIKVKTAGAETPWTRPRCCSRTAALCIHRNPVIHDEMVADPVEEQTDVDRYADINKIEAMASEEKWQFFEDLLSPCIRCYACRNACPLCYCPTCFVDESKPQWVGKSQDPIDVRTFHFCGPTTAPAAAPTAVPANGPARWASTCVCSPQAGKGLSGAVRMGSRACPGSASGAGCLPGQ